MRKPSIRSTIIHLIEDRRFAIILLITLWIILNLVVNPQGDFPLNDDWVYGKAVRSILDTGSFSLAGGNTSANLITQAYWGAIFCLPFGFSFTALRISTLTAGLLGILATYELVKEISRSSRLAIMGAVLVALNPIYFGLSNTFMTDIPFYAITIWAILFLAKGLRYERNSLVAFGIILAYLGVFIRQIGIIILVAYAFAFVLRKGFSARNVITAITPALAGFFMQGLYQSWLSNTNQTTPRFNVHIEHLENILLSGDIAFILQHILKNATVGLVYLGLFTFPLLLPAFWKTIQKLPPVQKNRLVFGFSTFSVMMGAGIFLVDKSMPFGDNILFAFGLGPLTLRDTYLLATNLPSLPGWLVTSWKILTFFSIIAAIIMLLGLVLMVKNIITMFWKPGKRGDESRTWLPALILLIIVLYSAPIVLTYYFDRYLIFLIPLMLVLIFLLKQPETNGNEPGYMMITFFMLAMLPISIFSVASTHDYLNWNRTRWQALNELMTIEGIPAEKIDGGYEFNGWYLYDREDSLASNTQLNTLSNVLWFSEGDDYILSFGPIPEYSIKKTYPLENWLPFGPEKIFVLQKQLTP